MKTPTIKIETLNVKMERTFKMESTSPPQDTPPRYAPKVRRYAPKVRPQGAPQDMPIDAPEIPEIPKRFLKDSFKKGIP